MWQVHFEEFTMAALLSWIYFSANCAEWRGNRAEWQNKHAWNDFVLRMGLRKAGGLKVNCEWSQSTQVGRVEKLSGTQEND